MSLALWPSQVANRGDCPIQKRPRDSARADIWRASRWGFWPAVGTGEELAIRAEIVRWQAGTVPRSRRRPWQSDLGLSERPGAGERRSCFHRSRARLGTEGNLIEHRLCHAETRDPCARALARCVAGVESFGAGGH